MAMPSGNVGGGGDIHHRQWFLDERDGFISWLRGEFAASNAIIDSLCHHFRSIGEPGEYDLVIGCIQQRRCNWNSVLHMQQYFSVAEVIYALQQVAWRRQQMYFEQGKVGSKESRRFGVGSRQGQRGDSVKEVHNSSVMGNGFNGNSSSAIVGSAKGQQVSDNCEEVKSEKDAVKLNDKELAAVEEKKDPGAKSHARSSLNSSGNSEGTMIDNFDLEAKVGDDGCTLNSEENNSHTIHNHNEKQIRTPISKSFIGTEIFDGKTVNVVDGLKLYEKLIDDTEVSKLVSLANDLRAAGKRGQFQGQTYVVLKRPMKGHGREMIQLGLPIADAPPEDENAAGTSKDQRIESIPALLQDLVERMVDMQIITARPDSCIIDFYNEGDHSQPHMWPTWFGRPISILFLTECDMTFGRAIGVDHPGDYRGSLKLSLAPGSLLMMQGKSADFAKHAIPSLRKQRVLVTFTKSQPRKFMTSDGQRLPSSPSPAPLLHWGPPPSRSPNHIRHPAGPKHYVAAPSTGVLPAPQIRPQIPPPNSIQPLFVTTPVAAPLSFPATVSVPPGSTGWPAAPPRHPPPRLPIPGTGVFLPPPGSENSSPRHQSTSATDTNSTAEMDSIPEEEDGSGKSNKNASASRKGKLDEKVQRQECNGSLEKEELQLSVDNTVASKPAAAD